MSHLYTAPAGDIPGFPGALFRAHDDIPTTECETAAGAPTAENIANEAHAQGKAHTFANGKLYTDLTVAQMTTFCSVAYAPQT